MKQLTLTYTPYILMGNITCMEQTIHPAIIRSIVQFSANDHCWVSWVDDRGAYQSDYAKTWSVEIFGKVYTKCDQDFINANTAWEHYLATQKALDQLD